MEDKEQIKTLQEKLEYVKMLLEDLHDEIALDKGKYENLCHFAEGLEMSIQKLKKKENL